MPELPEVETVRRGLDESLTGKKITGLETGLPKMLRGKSARAFAGAIAGAKVTGVKRRGKFLLIVLDNGFTMIAHLKMTGQLTLVKGSAPSDEYTHIVIGLSGGKELRFRDVRQFGFLELRKTADIGESGERLPALGPEPLSRAFTRGVFDFKIRKRTKSRIKTLLMDQSFVAGLGNIYADEVLYLAGVRPTRRAGTLTAKEKDKIFAAIRSVLSTAIEKKGTTVRDFVGSDGEPGGYQQYLKVYGRTDEPCPECGGVVKRVVIGGRSSHYCPKCQK